MSCVSRFNFSRCWTLSFEEAKKRDELNHLLGLSLKSRHEVERKPVKSSTVVKIFFIQFIQVLRENLFVNHRISPAIQVKWTFDGLHGTCLSREMILETGSQGSCTSRAGVISRVWQACHVFQKLFIACKGFSFSVLQTLSRCL